MKTHNTPINIIIADDHPVFLDGFRMIFKKIPGFNLVGEATNGADLLDLARNLKPDIIITDIIMPGSIDGIEVARRLTAELPSIGIIALSMIDEHSLIADMIEAGAKGYLIKYARAEEITTAIKTVHNGGNYYCKETTANVVKLLAKKECINKEKKIQFSEREMEIIKLICQQHSNKEIANRLYLAKRTIDWHRNQILEKLDAKNTAGIIIYAVKNNIC